MANLTHPSFTDPPIPIALTQHHTNKGMWWHCAHWLQHLAHHTQAMQVRSGNTPHTVLCVGHVCIQQIIDLHLFKPSGNSPDHLVASFNAVAASLDAAVKAAAAVLAAASKPVLLGGPRLRAHHRRDAFKQLAEAFKVSLTLTWHASSIKVAYDVGTVSLQGPVAGPMFKHCHTMCTTTSLP